MALVKKLQPGGNIDQTALNEALNTELGSYNLKSKDERKVRDALTRLRDFSATSGNSFTADQVAQKFIITGPGSNQFQGSPDDVKSNWFTGKLKINDDQDAMSVAAAIYAGAHKNIQGSSSTTSTTPTKTSINIGDYDKYLVDDIYGGPDVFRQDFRKLKTNDLRQKEYLTNMKDYIDKYQLGWDKDIDKYDYADKDKINELRAALGDGNIANWDKVVPIARKLGWNPNHILVNDVDLATYAEEDAKTKQTNDVAQANKYSTDLQGKGLLPNISNPLLNAGYVPVERLNPAGYSNDQIEAFNNYILNKKGFMFQAPGGQQIAIDIQGNPIQSNGSEFDQFNPLTGKAWGGDYTTGFQYGEGKYKASDEDNDENDRGRGLDIPQLQGWGRATGYSRNSKDVAHAKLGENRDYTKYIEFNTPKGKITLTKDDKGVYTSSTGETYPKLWIKGYKPDYDVNIENYDAILNDVDNPLSSIPTNNDYGSLTDALTSLAEQKQAIIKDGTYSSVGEMQKLAGYMKHIIATAKPGEDKRKALATYAELREIFKNNNIPTNKLGGVIKAQKGMSFAEYNAKYSPKPNTTQTTAPGNKPAVSAEGMLKNMNTLDAISLAGTTASFIPGIGVIGGAVSTVADLVNDINKGKSFGETSVNLGMNLGFTALAFFGAGGLKALKVGVEAAKIGKAADFAVDLTTAGKKAEALIKLAKKSESSVDLGTKALLESTLKVSNISKSLGGEGSKILKAVANADNVASLDEPTKLILKNAGYIDDAGNVLKKEGTKLIQADLGIAHGIQNQNITKVSRIANNWIKEPIETTGKAVIDKSSKLLNNKTVSGIARTAFIGGTAGTGGYGIIKDYNSAPENLSWNEKLGRTQTSDWSNLLMGASTARNTLKGNRYKRALENQTEPSTVKEAVHKITLGETTHELSSPLTSLPKNFKSKVWETKAAETTHIERVKKELSEKLKISDPTEKEKVINDFFKDKKISDLKNSLEPREEGELVLREFVNNRFKDQARSIKEYELAKKIIERDIKSVGRLNASPWGTKKFEAKKKTSKPAEVTKSSEKPKQFLPPPTKSGVVIPPPSFKKPSVVKVNEQLINKVNKKATPRDKSKKGWTGETHWMLEGGILKYQNAAQSSMGPLNNPTWKKGYTNTLQNTGVDYGTGLSLKATQQFTVPSQPRTGNYYGGVTNELIQKNWNPEILKAAGLDPTNVSTWPSNTPQLLQKYIETRPELISQLKDQTSPSHNKFGMDWYYTGLKSETPSTQTTTTTPTGTPAAETKPIVIPATGPTTNINSNVIQKPGIWDSLKGTLDSTGIANGLMYLNTLGANAWIGNEQRKAISSGLFQLPYMPHQYIRADKPYSLAANKQAADVNSQGKKIAASTSDLNQGNAIRLQALKQASGIIEKGQALDWERLDKVREMQLKNNASVDSYNTQTLGKNRGLTAEAMQKIHLTNANQRNAQNTATNNWLTAWDKNYGLNQYKQNMAKYFDMTNDPKLKSLSDEYTDFAGEKGKASALATYNANKANYDKTHMPGGVNGGTQYKPFEESDEYKQWQTDITKKLDYLKLQMKPLELAQQKLNLDQQMLYWRKEGGKMTKKEKIDIDNNKFNNVKRLKETELTYKAIMHNNEMLQKALIKVFK